MRTLAEVAKGRAIAMPIDLEAQIATMFSKPPSTLLSRQTSKWMLASKTPKMERSQSQVSDVYTI